MNYEWCYIVKLKDMSDNSFREVMEADTGCIELVNLSPEFKYPSFRIYLFRYNLADSEHLNSFIQMKEVELMRKIKVLKT